MAEDISKAVDLGLKLSKRIRTEKPISTAPPESESMQSKHETTCPMAYAVITKPGIVDNPDIRSYQPYVHGKCEPPALIPLEMKGVEMEVDCCLDTAFVTVKGTWRLHCVTASKSSHCRVAVPMGEQGSVLGVEVESPEKIFQTQLIGLEDNKQTQGSVKARDGFLLKRKIYTIQVPKVAGGSLLSIKVRWSQRLLYQDGCFSLHLPFSFPSYVNPIGKISKKEKIALSLNSGTGTEVTCECASHHLKVISRQAGKLGLLYEREVSRWSSNDFNFSYNVSARDISGHLFLQSPSLQDVDRREMFCLYLFPGNSKNKKVFMKEVVYVVDISSSMSGGPLENVKCALLEALQNLSSGDSFNIIAFNHSSSSFSKSLVPATSEAIDGAIQWVDTNFVAEGGTNLSVPLHQAIRMMSGSAEAIPLIFLITDGACEDEKEICQVLRSDLVKGGLNSPRICTFGIGSYCNHYFLQMLAQIGRGCYDAAYDLQSISRRMERLLQNASSVTFADLHVDAFEHLDSLELHPFQVPDLLAGSPLTVFGRFSGDFPDSVNIRGILPDMRSYIVNVKVQQDKGMQIEKVFARRIIDALTAQAWLSGNKDTKSKIANLSLHTGVPSEYTSMILNEKDKRQPSKIDAEEKLANAGDTRTIILLPLGVGFGNLKATTENLPLSASEPRLYETSEMILKAASTCCGRVMDQCCCMCFIQSCSRLSDRCAVTFTQLCGALACFECFNICFDVCCECG
ncbi:hypothetical protein LIER_06351 [Lithospermum erythrorhizon]|uniref:VWFA domain-containing protein n=1 Tax=Lithospermum erythrorhizon TaxID=34254 RepID=A0AAV3P6N9_LITER